MCQLCNASVRPAVSPSWFNKRGKTFFEGSLSRQDLAVDGWGERVKMHLVYGRTYKREKSHLAARLEYEWRVTLHMLHI